ASTAYNLNTKTDKKLPVKPPPTSEFRLSRILRIRSLRCRKCPKHDRIARHRCLRNAVLPNLACFSPHQVDRLRLKNPGGSNLVIVTRPTKTELAEHRCDTPAVSPKSDLSRCHPMLAPCEH